MLWHRCLFLLSTREAYEWLEGTLLELHRERSTAPDLLRLRKDGETLATWQTHFDVVS